jgi:hypothetical protein
MLSSGRSSQFKEMSWILGLSYANGFGVHQAVLDTVYKSVVFLSWELVLLLYYCCILKSVAKFRSLTSVIFQCTPASLLNQEITAHIAISFYPSAHPSTSSQIYS